MPSIDLGVAGQFLHPPLESMILEPIFLPGQGFNISGVGTLTKPALGGLVNVDAFGVLYSVELEPPGAGFTLGSVTQYDRRVIQLVERRRLRDGNNVVNQVFNGNYDNGFLLFGFNPLQIDFWIAPLFVVDLYWLVVLAD
jgi:hypothetical protein